MTEQEAIIFIQNAMEQSRKALAELMLLNPQLFKEKSKILGEYYSNLENCKKEIESCKVAIKALEEIQQYREIGTVEECRAAVEIIRYMIQEGIEPEVLKAYVRFEDELVKKGFTIKSILEAREKQIAAKPLGGMDADGNDYAICRECSAILSDGEWFAQYCPDCGKKVDWGG